MDTIAGLIAQHPFFEGLAPATVGLLAAHGAAETVPEDSYLLREGMPADRFFAVRQGRVSIELRTPAGAVVVDTAHDGDVVGWSWLIPPHRWMFDARTSRQTELLLFDAVPLRAAAEADPGIGYALTRRIAEVMAHRLHSARVRLLDLYGEVDD